MVPINNWILPSNPFPRFRARVFFFFLSNNNQIGLSKYLIFSSESFPWISTNSSDLAGFHNQAPLRSTVDNLASSCLWASHDSETIFKYHFHPQLQTLWNSSHFLPILGFFSNSTSYFGEFLSSKKLLPFNKFSLIQIRRWLLLLFLLFSLTNYNLLFLCKQQTKIDFELHISLFWQVNEREIAMVKSGHLDTSIIQKTEGFERMFLKNSSMWITMFWIETSGWS